MMKVIALLLFAVLISTKHASAQTCGAIDQMIDQKIQAAVNSAVSTVCNMAKLSRTAVSSSSADAFCPSDYKATGCSCGMGCGSWEIRDESGCHCQCVGIDWTYARCCKVTC